MELNEQGYKIKKGDFIRCQEHFGDVFFEVIDVYNTHVVFARYSKYGSEPETKFTSISRIKEVVPAEMGMFVIVWKRQRFHASFGQYDPFYGFAPVGTALRKK
jgi:hypothetical protein